jgi:polar amino acid transport system substrate-binding protein
VPSLSRFLLPVLLLAPCPALAEKMRVCTDTHPHPPLLTPDGGGLAGQRLARAAREIGVEIVFLALPLERCKVDIAAGKLDAFPLTPFSPSLQSIVRYPERQGQADPARASAMARLMVFRRTGAAANWDGARFFGLQRPVLIASSSVIVRDRLLALGVPFDENGRSLANNFAKILAGRSDVAIGWEHEGKLLLRDAKYAGRIEMQAQPLAPALAYYLGVNHEYYRRNTAQVEKLWDALGRQRAAPSVQPAKPLRK